MNIESTLNAIRPEQQTYTRPPKAGHHGSEAPFSLTGHSPEPEETTTPAKVLSASEKESLHMLFGSEKPETMQFYNNETTPMTPKGHFIDLIG